MPHCKKCPLAWSIGPGRKIAARHAPGALGDGNVAIARSIARQLPNLRKLELARNNITDAGVQHLMGLKKLEKLNLSYTRIADKGLMTLGKLPSLNYLNVRRCRVTPRGRDKFEKTPTGRRAGFSLVN